MYYFDHNIGDYRRDTGHLSLLEHGVYRQLLDTYYMDEAPLCLDHAKLMRSHSVRSAEEVQAFENVLADFFERTERGYVHKRCEEVIAGYRKKSEGAKAAAKARWAKELEERKAGAMRTHCEGNANHKPITNNHKGAKAPSAPRRKITLGESGWEGIPETLFSRWAEAYPAVVLKTELAKAAAWIIANPDNRKSNYARFLTNWLTRAQDNAPSRRNGSQQVEGWHEKNERVMAELTGRNSDERDCGFVFDV